MEITLETIYQQMKADTAELRTEIRRLDDRINSVKTWSVTLSLSTILVVSAIVTTFLTMFIAR